MLLNLSLIEKYKKEIEKYDPYTISLIKGQLQIQCDNKNFNLDDFKKIDMKGHDENNLWYGKETKELKITIVQPNTIILNEKSTTLNLYKVNICKVVTKTKEIKVDEKYYNYSPTIARERNKFLGLSSKEIEKGIKDGVIKVENLN